MTHMSPRSLAGARLYGYANSAGFGCVWRRCYRCSNRPLTRNIRSRLSTLLLRQLMRQGSCPAAVTQRMHFHPDSVLPLAQLQRAWATWHPKVPMMAAGSPGQLALASNDQTAAAALVEDLPGGELDSKFEHGVL
jgi:hypothetical protein